MNNTSNNGETNSTTYSPKTEKEKAEAYKLLDDFMKELARLQAFRELVAAKLSGREKGRKGYVHIDPDETASSSPNTEN